MSDSNELYYAEMESARHEREAIYFLARPQLDTEENRRIFRAGFERAFSELWNRIPSQAQSKGGE